MHAQQLIDLMPEAPRGPAQMSFENLANVHARRNTERIKHYVNRSPVIKIRHVFFGQNSRNDAFVAMSPCHFVADLKLALDRDKNLDHLDNRSEERRVGKECM